MTEKKDSDLEGRPREIIQSKQKFKMVNKKKQNFRDLKGNTKRSICVIIVSEEEEKKHRVEKYLRNS